MHAIDPYISPVSNVNMPIESPFMISYLMVIVTYVQSVIIYEIFAIEICTPIDFVSYSGSMSNVNMPIERAYSGPMSNVNMPIERAYSGFYLMALCKHLRVISNQNVYDLDRHLYNWPR